MRGLTTGVTCNVRRRRTRRSRYDVAPTHPRDEKIAWEHGCEVKSLPPSLHSPTHDGGSANGAGDKPFKPTPESRNHAQTNQVGTDLGQLPFTDRQFLQ